jgi:hypothetical protein
MVRNSYSDPHTQQARPSVAGICDDRSDNRDARATSREHARIIQPVPRRDQQRFPTAAPHAPRQRNRPPRQSLPLASSPSSWPRTAGVLVRRVRDGPAEARAHHVAPKPPRATPTPSPEGSRGRVRCRVAPCVGQASCPPQGGTATWTKRAVARAPWPRPRGYGDGRSVCQSARGPGARRTCVAGGQADQAV